MPHTEIKNWNPIPCFIVFICIFFFAGCGETQINLEETETDSPTFVPPMNPKEKEEIVTNPLFEALVGGQSTNDIDNIISNIGIPVTSINKRGDTVLGTAIQLKLKEKVFFLLEKFQCKDLSHQNNNGESYVYLAAKNGYADLIHRIVGKCYENDFFNGSNYEFSNLDPETENGEIAIHIALNGSVASALDYEYTKGTMEYSWWIFHKANDQEESFLHTAVNDGRSNTIEWAIHTYCHKGEWEQEDSGWWKRIPSAIFQKVWNGLQAFTWNISQLINYQDINGNTALHLASKSFDEQNIRLLSNCRWMDFLIENEEGNIALQVFLQALDHLLKEHSQNIKDIFVFLTHRETSLKKWITNISDTVNHQNKQGDSALHISARLADPFFYNYLKQYADLYLKNNSGETPSAIFHTTQSRVDHL